MKKSFTLLILAANADGVETLQAIHVMANGVRDLSEKKIEINFDNLYGNGAYKARGGELAGIIPGHVQVLNLMGGAHRAEAMREAWIS